MELIGSECPSCGHWLTDDEEHDPSIVNEDRSKIICPECGEASDMEEWMVLD
jgi:endogenous inhibitor of DNA gyrase (YacG/DUF329 family)